MFIRRCQDLLPKHTMDTVCLTLCIEFLENELGTCCLLLANAYLV